MQGLKLEELEEGHIYKCLLSGRNVLITSKTRKKVKQNDAPPIEWLDVSAQIFDENTYSTNTYLVWDYQLQELNAL